MTSTTTDTILWRIELKLCFTSIICEQKLNQSVDTIVCERSEGAEDLLAECRQSPFSIYSWTIRIMCYAKVWKHIITICSLLKILLRRGFWIWYAILVTNFDIYKTYKYMCIFMYIYICIYKTYRLFLYIFSCMSR